MKTHSSPRSTGIPTRRSTSSSPRRIRDPSSSSSWSGRRTAISEEVYLHLAAHRRFDVVRAIATEFMGRGEPLFIDRRADLLARLALSGAGDLSQLIADLQVAIQRHPRSPHFYDALGEAYRRRGEPDDSHRARRCYERVRELVEKGEFAERARRALAEIESERSAGAE
jgi:hypothetical protein